MIITTFLSLAAYVAFTSWRVQRRAVRDTARLLRQLPYQERADLLAAMSDQGMRTDLRHLMSHDQPLPDQLSVARFHFAPGSWRELRWGVRRPLIALALALGALVGCAGVSYQSPGQPVTPHAGKVLLFGRLRFFHDGSEFFPWEVKIVVFPVANTERHVWLLRLSQRAVSAELHPGQDGSLAIWLATGDYALVGSTEAMGAGTGAFYVVALFRVPAATAEMYAGDLIFRTESHEGGHWSYGEFGNASVDMPSIDSARATLERRFGPLPGPPALLPWCTGDSLPGFNDPELATRGRELLDRGCPAA